MSVRHASVIAARILGSHQTGTPKVNLGWAAPSGASKRTWRRVRKQLRTGLSPTTQKRLESVKQRLQPTGVHELGLRKPQMAEFLDAVRTIEADIAEAEGRYDGNPIALVRSPLVLCGPTTGTWMEANGLRYLFETGDITVASRY